jgi:hypothetical protein
MTTAATQLTARALGLDRARPDVLSAATLALLVAALSTFTWGTWGDLTRDTGYDLVAAARVAHGGIPYVDFTYYYGPLAPALLGLATFVGHGGLAPAFAVGLCLAVATVGLTYAAGRELVPRAGALAAAAITAAAAVSPGNLSVVLPHTTATPIAVVALLCLVLCATRYAREARPRWLRLAGCAVAAVALARPDFAPAAFLAAAVWLGVRKAGGAPARETLTLGAPAVLVPAAVYGSFLAATSPHRLILENLYPAQQLHEAGNSVLRLHAPLTAGSFAHLGGRLVLYALGAAAMLAVGRTAAGLAPRIRVAALAALALAAAGAAVADPGALRSGLQEVYGWIPAGAILAVCVALVRARRRRWQLDSRTQGQLLLATILSVLAAREYAAFFPWATREQPAMYLVPFAALLLAQVHLVELSRFRLARTLGLGWLAFLAAAGIGLTLQDASARSATVHGPGGSLRTNPAQAAVFQGALRWIETQTRPGDPILLAPQLTALYVLADRRDPLPQLSLLPGALPHPADEQAAIERLTEQHVRLAVVDRHRFPEYGHTFFGGSFDRELAGWIRSHFDHAATVRGGPGAGDHVLDIWVWRNR